MEKFELINNYINGKLSPEEKTNFEHALRSDENLKNMLDHENLMKEAVSKFRTAQLKARMDRISVGSSLSNSLKVFTALMILVGGTAGTYYFLSTHDTQTATNTGPNLPLLNKPTAIKPNVAEAKAPLKEQTKAVKTEKDRSIKAERPEVGSAEINPSVHQDDIDVAAPSDFNSHESTTPQGDLTSSVKSPKTDVTVEVNDSEELRYKNFNSKLFLMGKFNQKYEIIELKAHQLYLSYDSNFYYLRNNVQKFTTLEKVTEPSLLKTLNEKLRDHSN
ncbi:MAG TPA: hypothetical protein VL947_02720 [Cytophagales bacterium]|nr:hypothetical protein [Cytophagales bacterium]